MKNIYLIFGESGAGKTSIANKLEYAYGLKQLQSYTTRKPRVENEQGHIFVTNKEFDGLVDMVAYTEFCGNRYCATAAQVEECDVYVIDIDGINYFKKHYHGTKGVKTIYIKVSEEERRKRLTKRDGESAAANRINNDKHEFTNCDKIADVVYVNENVKFGDIVHKVYRYIQRTEKGR